MTSLRSNVPRDYKESKSAMERMVYALLPKSLGELETAAAGSGKAFRCLDAMGVLVLHGMKDAGAACLGTTKNQSQ